MTTCMDELKPAEMDVWSLDTVILAVALERWDRKIYVAYA